MRFEGPDYRQEPAAGGRDSAERRRYGAYFLFLPICIFSFACLGQPYLDRAGPGGFWFYMMGCLMVLGLCSLLWARFVPTSVSVILGIVVWGVAVLVAIIEAFSS